MPVKNKPEICDQCHQGKVIKTMQDMTFHQWTSKGDVSCRVTIPIGVCDNCGAKSWNEATEAIIEEAVKRETDKLS